MDRSAAEPAISFGCQENLKALFDVIMEDEESLKPITVICGAGISGFGDWVSLVNLLIKVSVKNTRDRSFVTHSRGELPRKAGFALSYGRSKSESEVIRKVLYRSGSEGGPLPLAQAVVRLKEVLPHRIRLVTTNIDDQLEQALRSYRNDESGAVSLGINEEDMRIWEESGLTQTGVVLHLHGMVPRHLGDKTVEPIILSEPDYLENGHRVRDTVEQLLCESHVIFLGTSLHDPNIIEPLFRSRPARRERGCQVFALFPPDGDGRAHKDVMSQEDLWPRQYHTFLLKRRDYYEDVLGVKSVLLKSFWQVAQVVNDLVLASIQPDLYRSNDPDLSFRYGHRLRRALNSSYQALGIRANRAYPEGDEIAEISRKLRQVMAVDEGPGGYLRQVVVNEMSGVFLREIGLARSYLTEELAEGLGLFLWLRPRVVSTDGIIPHQLRLIGSSVFVHHNYWSFRNDTDIVAGFSITPDVAFHGMPTVGTLQDERTFSLWNSALAVPILWNRSHRGDVLNLGVMTLHSTRWLVDPARLQREVDKQTKKKKQISIMETFSPSVLGILDPSELTELVSRLSEAAAELLTFDQSREISS